MRKLEFTDKAVVAAFVIVFGIAVVGFGLYLLLPAEDPVARNVNAPKVPYTACYYETGNIATDKPYLLIDLSDSTNWPHSATNEVILKSVAVQGTVSGAHRWHLSVGVVVENDATNGTAAWVDSKQVIAVSGAFYPPQRIFAEGGMNLRATSDAMVYGVANGTSNLTSWQSDTAISATVGTTGLVAVGDVVILADEITDGSTLDFCICVDYDTE